MESLLNSTRLSEAYEAEAWPDRAIEILRRVYEENGDEMLEENLV